MSSKGFEDRDAIFKITEKFKLECLMNGGSIFGGGQVWNTDSFSQLNQYFVQTLDAGEGTFYSKLKKQLNPASDPSKILAAELIWLILLFLSNITPSKKRENIQTILSWSNFGDTTNVEALKENVLIGIGSGGPGVNNYLWREFKFAIILFTELFQKSDIEKDDLLSSPWEFAEWIDAMKDGKGRQFRHMLLYLLFPEYFERISSKGHKDQLLSAFFRYLDNHALNTRLEKDQGLFEIRSKLVEELGTDEIDFYMPPIVQRWKSDEMDMYDIIQRFLDQANTLNLTTKDYPKNIEGYQMKVGFGQGTQTRIPWIAFLGEGQKVQDGIYPVFLYFKEDQKLILSFGLSETENPSATWDPEVISNYRTVAETLPNPARYSQSYVFKEYDVNLNSLSEIYDRELVNNDFQEIIGYYDSTLEMNAEALDEIDSDIEELLQRIDSIRVDYDSNGLPRRYKALVLLSSLDLIDNDPLNKFIFEDTFNTFYSLADKYEIKAGKDQYANGFYRLKNDKILSMIHKEGQEAIPSGKAIHYSEVANVVDYACFDENDWAILREEGNREQIRNFIINKWFDAKVTQPTAEGNLIDKFNKAVNSIGLKFENGLENKLVAALCTKPFLLLTGLSGSGKTKLAQAFSAWITDDSNRADSEIHTTVRYTEKSIGNSFGWGLKKEVVSKLIGREDANIQASIAGIEAKKCRLEYKNIFYYKSDEEKDNISTKIKQNFQVGDEVPLILKLNNRASNLSKQYEMVAVGADWTSNENILGYPDALNPGVYRKPENGALDLILRAKNDPYTPYFLILDEMNLSHVERYFADFLSSMESEEPINLHDGGESDLWPTENGGVPEVPGKVKIPKNLFVIGTVNVDETTYMFSPKVLDRANVIEFRVSEKDMGEFLLNPQKPEIQDLAGEGKGFAPYFVSKATQKDVILDDDIKGKVGDVLQQFFPELQKVGSEFGYRSAQEICRFIFFYQDLSTEFDFDTAMDAVVMQKLLPKLHGSKKKLSPVLEALMKLSALDPEASDLKDDPGKYPVSMEKLKRMQERLETHGFTSFAEA